MKKAIVVLASVLVLTLGLQQLNLAWGRGPGRMTYPASKATSRATRFFDGESLTQEQRTRIVALHEKYFREMTVLRQRLQEVAFAYRQARIIDSTCS